MQFPRRHAEQRGGLRERLTAARVVAPLKPPMCIPSSTLPQITLRPVLLVSTLCVRPLHARGQAWCCRRLTHAGTHTGTARRRSTVALHACTTAAFTTASTAPDCTTLTVCQLRLHHILAQPAAAMQTAMFTCCSCGHGSHVGVILSSRENRSFFFLADNRQSCLPAFACLRLLACIFARIC